MAPNLKAMDRSVHSCLSLCVLTQPCKDLMMWRQDLQRLRKKQRKHAETRRKHEMDSMISKNEGTLCCPRVDLAI